MGKILSRSLGIDPDVGDPIPTFDFITLANMRDGIAQPVQVVGIDITDNGEYEAPPGYAYSPVNVNVQGGGAAPVLIEKTITENGTYSAADDDADGYSEVTVNVQGVPVQYPYYLGGYDVQENTILTARDNHFRVDFTSSGPSITIGMRSFREMNLSNTWFTINAGDTYEIEFFNVENPSNINWNSNAKRANSSTSLSYGIGNGTHLDGAVVSGTQVNTENIGCWFLWCGSCVADSYLAFDMSIKINGTRIL